jgi:adenylate cyclase
MSKPSDSIIERVAQPTVWVPLAVLVGALALSITGAWQGGDRAWFDFLLKTRILNAPLVQSPRIFPVDLNDRAERNLGAAVDSRQAFADLFTVLGDGKLAGGMDFLFSGSANPQGDANMVAAASKMDGLVMAVVPVDQGTNKFTGKELAPEEEAVIAAHLWNPVVLNAGRIPVAETFLLPNLELAKNSRYLGHIGVRPDSDGLYRKSALFFRYGDGYMPALSLAMAAYSLKIDPTKIVINAGVSIDIPVKDTVVRIPVDDEGYAWVPFPSSWDKGWRRLPMDKVVAAASDTDLEDEMLNLLGDGLVVVADLTTSHKDFGPTPFESIYPLSGIHTSLLNGMLTGQFFRSPSALQLAALIAALVLAVLLLTTRKAEWWLHAGFAAVAAALVAWSVTAWWFFQEVPWLTAPLVAVVLAWLAGLVLRLMKTHEERTLMESALTRYFPRALASRVMDEGKVDLKPAEKDLTIMFSDISGFTKWSSDKPAELVHGFLSDYLESMAHILFSHGGTVDKFMGDGILAFFGDPFEQPDHVQRCINAAIAMQLRVKELQQTWGEKAGIDLKIRIGINTGHVIVGNLGSITRIEYTVIGSAVNLAQRMESNAPLEGILVTADTYQRVKNEYRFSPKLVKVKGYDDGIEAWVVEGKV